jgi:hypothetical protein
LSRHLPKLSLDIVAGGPNITLRFLMRRLF